MKRTLYVSLHPFEYFPFNIFWLNKRKCLSNSLNRSLSDFFNKATLLETEREGGLFGIEGLKSPQDYSKMASVAVEKCMEKMEELKKVPRGSRQVIKFALISSTETFFSFSFLLIGS